MSHTPEPWVVDIDRQEISACIADVVAACRGDYDQEELELEDYAIARVIAAAPLLLGALQALGVKPDGYCFCINAEQAARGHTGECLEARAAIAKAEGEGE